MRAPSRWCCERALFAYVSSAARGQHAKDAPRVRSESVAAVLTRTRHPVPERVMKFTPMRSTGRVPRHPCTTQGAFECSPKLCPFLHHPEDFCLKMLRTGQCPDNEAGTCPWVHEFSEKHGVELTHGNSSATEVAKMLLAIFRDAWAEGLEGTAFRPNQHVSLGTWGSVPALYIESSLLRVALSDHVEELASIGTRYNFLFHGGPGSSSDCERVGVPLSVVKMSDASLAGAVITRVNELTGLADCTRVDTLCAVDALHCFVTTHQDDLRSSLGSCHWLLNTRAFSTTIRKLCDSLFSSCGASVTHLDRLLAVVPRVADVLSGGCHERRFKISASTLCECIVSLGSSLGLLHEATAWDRFCNAGFPTSLSLRPRIVKFRAHAEFTARMMSLLGTEAHRFHEKDARVSLQNPRPCLLVNADVTVVFLRTLFLQGRTHKFVKAALSMLQVSKSWMKWSRKKTFGPRSNSASLRVLRGRRVKSQRTLRSRTRFVVETVHKMDNKQAEGPAFEFPPLVFAVDADVVAAVLQMCHALGREKEKLALALNNDVQGRKYALLSCASGQYVDVMRDAECAASPLHASWKTASAAICVSEDDRESSELRSTAWPLRHLAALEIRHCPAPLLYLLFYMAASTEGCRTYFAFFDHSNQYLSQRTRETGLNDVKEMLMEQPRSDGGERDSISPLSLVKLSPKQALPAWCGFVSGLTRQSIENITQVVRSLTLLTWILPNVSTHEEATHVVYALLTTAAVVTYARAAPCVSDGGEGVVFGNRFVAPSRLRCDAATFCNYYDGIQQSLCTTSTTTWTALVPPALHSIFDVSSDPRFHDSCDTTASNGLRLITETLQDPPLQLGCRLARHIHGDAERKRVREWAQSKHLHAIADSLGSQ